MAEKDKLQDAFLDKFVGKWRIARQFKSRTSENAATIEWILDHQFLRIQMIDVNEPPEYEAHVYLGFDASKSKYVCHWIDVFGGQYSCRGYGEREENSIRIAFEDDLVNTFTFNEGTGTWTSKIDQTNDKGEWVNFCVDTYSKA